MGGDRDRVDVADPVARFSALLDAMADAQRRLLDAWGEITAWGGLPGASGWSGEEWLRVVQRLPRRDARRLQQVTQRLVALPVTSAAYRSGRVSYDQLATIVELTAPLSGAALAEVDRLAAATAADVNARGDDPCVADEVALLVRDHRGPAELRRLERRAEHGQQVRWQGDLDGGGLLWAELDGVSFSTVVTAVEAAAGPPAPDRTRRSQRADGLTALARQWLGGDASPGLAGPEHTGDHADRHGRAPAGTRPARPAVTVVVDLTDVTTTTAGLVLRAAGPHTPWLTARALDTLTCDADLAVHLVEGARPLAELRDRRTLPEAVRRAVRVRDRGCRWPGCSAPVLHTDVHHVRHRADGGTHEPDNLVLLCRRHHTRTHAADARGRPTWHTRLESRTGAYTISRSATFDGATTHTTLPHGHRPQARLAVEAAQRSRAREVATAR
jgi:hypothetical protein